MENYILPAILVFLVLAAVTWVRRRAQIKRAFRNIPGLSSGSFLQGKLPLLLHRHSMDWTKNFVETYGPVSKISGPFGRTWLHVYDPKALYHMAIKDQDIWHKNSGRFLSVLLGPGLLTTEGSQHRKQRKMLTPVFSIAYLRNITSVFYETTFKMRDAMKDSVGQGTKEIDVMHWTGRAALELLGQGAFAHSFDPLVQNATDARFADSVKRFFSASNRIAMMRLLSEPFMFLPLRLRRLIVDWTPIERVQAMKNIVDVMYNRSVEIVGLHKVATEKGDPREGKDVMSILLQANASALEKEQLSDEELHAQVSTFILAGMDTTSNATCRLLHLLSQNPDVQVKLREEILDAQAGQEIPYDTLMDLPYLDAVCRETLRLYGPVRLTTRRASQDTVLYFHEPIRTTDGSMITELAVPKGTVAIQNLWACNTNKALWGEDAYEWKPQRWLEPLPRALEEARVPGVYSNLMSFQGGGRSCIGFKYAQLELKVMLSVLLTHFKFELTDKPIVWNAAGVSYPSVGKESTKPEMPMKVTLIAS